MGSTSILTRTLEWVSAERSFRNLAYDIVRVIASLVSGHRWRQYGLKYRPILWQAS